MRTDIAHARGTDPRTSLEAADSLDGTLRESQALVLEILKRHGPMADHQLLELVPKMSPSGVRSRRAELVDRRLVRDSGASTFTPSGRRTIIWEAAL